MKIDNHRLVGGPPRDTEPREKVTYDKPLCHDPLIYFPGEHSLSEDGFSMSDHTIANILQHHVGFKAVVCVGCKMTVNMCARHSDFQCPRCEHNNLHVVAAPNPEYALMPVDSDVLKHPTPIHERPDIGPSIERMEDVVRFLQETDGILDGAICVRNPEQVGLDYGDMVVESTPGKLPDGVLGGHPAFTPALESYIPASGKAPDMTERERVLKKNSIDVVAPSEILAEHGIEEFDKRTFKEQLHDTVLSATNKQAEGRPVDFKRLAKNLKNLSIQQRNSYTPQ